MVAMTVCRRSAVRSSVVRAAAVRSGRVARVAAAPAPAPRLAEVRVRRDVSAFGFFSQFRKSSSDAGIEGAQGRDDYDKDDIEQYFNYMGLLAVEGSYDSMDAMIDSGLPAIDILLVMAAKEADTPKVEELLNAGADRSIVYDGKTVVEWAGANNEAKKGDVLELLE